MSNFDLLMADTLKAQEETVLASDFNAIEDIDVIMAYNETESEVNTLEAALVTIANTAKGLEGLEEFAEGAQATGGLEAQAAQGLIAGVDGILGAVGGKSSAVGMPDMQAFEGDGGRVVAGEATVEAIGQTIAKLWQKFLDMMKSAQKAVAKWYDENISQAGRLIKSAEALATKANEKAGTPEEAKLEVPRGQYLMSGGKLGDIKASDLDSYTTEISKLLFSKDLLSAGVDFGSKLESISSNLNDKSGEIVTTSVAGIYGSYNKNVVSALGLKEGAVKDKRVPKATDGATVMTVGLSLGDAFIAAVTKDSVATTVNVYGSEAPEAKTKLESKALTAAEIVAMADSVKKLCTEIVKVKADFRDGEKLDSAMEKNGNSLAKASLKQDKEMKGETKRELTKLINAIGTVSRNQRMVNRDLLKQASQTAGAAYGFAVASLKNLKEAK